MAAVDSTAPTSGKSALKLTIATCFLAWRSVQELGVEPDTDIHPAIDNPVESTIESDDPFASQREASEGVGLPADETAVKDSSISPPSSPQARDRRMSKEWDASKVPPSQFQNRKGSIYATPSSRDAHVKGSDRDKAYFEKLKEKGWNIIKKKD